jgi:ACS family glucarate transporter-like MFS transporter
MKYQHRVLGLLSLLSIITYLDRVCIAVAGPRMQESLRISPQAWGWVMSVFFISYSAFEIPSGILGDRIGPRRVLTRIVLWWSAFTSLTGAVVSYPLLLVVRFCFGMGEAGAYPNMAVVIGRWMPAAHRARSFGVIWMASQFGGALAPLLVVPILIHYGWHAAFYLFGLVGVLWSGVWYWWFRDSPGEKAGVSPAEIAEIGQGREIHGHQGLPWGVTLRSGLLWRVMAIAACYVYVLAFFQSWFQTFLVKGRGFGEVDLMLSTLPYLVGAGGNPNGILYGGKGTADLFLHITSNYKFCGYDILPAFGIFDIYKNPDVPGALEDYNRHLEKHLSVSWFHSGHLLHASKRQTP